MTRTAAGAPSESLLAAPDGYLRSATLPLPSLVLLLPLIALYEVGTRYLTTAAQEGKDQQIIAFSKMEEFFRMLGAGGRYMPAFAVIGILLAWHIVRNDSWRVDLRTIIGMGIESAVLSLPLLLLAFAVNRYFPLAALKGVSHASILAHSSVQDRIIMDLGAGVYEEFVFRLVLFTLLSLLLKDIIRLHNAWVYVLTVAGSGLLFSAYHYFSPNESFAWRVFAFRALAGVYFGMIFMLRGFGITAASHSAYDFIVTVF
ncbi:MAG TPA: CPBP family glutamic-type intramembrane protease [Tepidisphaeraceae bacterium]|nr:CPBP family glutamic-type intramembrane protease [Tepidisphaeraceae bacterium]